MKLVHAARTTTDLSLKLDLPVIQFRSALGDSLLSLGQFGKTLVMRRVLGGALFLGVFQQGHGVGDIVLARHVSIRPSSCNALGAQEDSLMADRRQRPLLAARTLRVAAHAAKRLRSPQGAVPQWVATIRDDG